MTSPKTDAETLEFFKALHRLMETHPNKELVNALHRRRNAPGVRLPYLEAAWVSFGENKNTQ